MCNCAPNKMANVQNSGPKNKNKLFLFSDRIPVVAAVWRKTGKKGEKAAIKRAK